MRVHPEYLQKQKLPQELVTKRIWKERFEDIRNFEQYLIRNGVVILKFFLHVSTVVIDALTQLKLEYPKVDEAKVKDLAAARQKLTKWPLKQLLR